MLLHSLKTSVNIRLKYNFYEKKKNILKFLIYSNIFKLSKRYILSVVLHSLPIKSSIAFIKNHCVVTGRSRGLISKYRVSRHTLKKLINTGNLYTLKKK